MRTYPVLLSLAVSIGAGIAAPDVAWSQEYRGTMEQQMACTPDVFRLCGDQIPDVNRIVSCLRQNTPQLSRPCRAVFETSANSPRRRDDRSRPYDRDERSRPYDRDDRPRRYDRDDGPRPYDRDDRSRPYEDGE